MLTLLLLHGLLAVVAPLAGRRLGPRVFFLCALAPLATVIWAVRAAGPVLEGGAVVQQLSWVEAMGISFDLRLDGFALIMVALISGIGVLIFAYARWYFSARPDLGRFAGTLTAFSGSMLGVVLADNLLVLYLFWELTSVTSYLLIGFEDRKAEARAAALQAILITGAGGLAMLGGFVIIGQAAGTYSLSAILASPPGGGAVGAGLVLVLLGAFTKSAQVPFHSWLPGAMAAPTPVSAYLHSATMVKAGVYLIARFAPAFALLYDFWRPLVIGVGLATMLLGGLRALTQHDIKLLLAYGTVSQLGFMVVLVGTGHPALTFAGVAIILAHGLFKATLFMLVGVIDHSAHTRDLRKLRGLGRRLPVMFGLAIVGVASMAGIPPLLGFAAKEAALEAALDEAGWLVSAGIVAGSVLTFAYGARFLWGAFGSKRDEERSPDQPVETKLDPQPPAILAPAILLGVLTLALGMVPAIAAGPVAAAAGSLDPVARAGRLYLWHGLTPALGFSALTVVLGSLLFVKRRQVERWQTARAIKVTAQGSYEAGLHGLLHGAGRLTGIVQNGSLPVYIAVIMLTAVALPGWALIRFGVQPQSAVLAESWLQVLVVAGVLAAALWMAVARQRFVAVLLLGAVGFGVAVLFVMQGAPDLAMTQLLIETLALIIFVLVLRHLPARFEPVGWKFGNGLRIAVAVIVGVFVAGFALVAARGQGTGHVGQELVQRSLPDGGGRNVVNVILTDFRALDTLGEIAVLVIAAFGIASLVLVGMRENGVRREEPMPFDRSLILSTSVDVVFPTALVFSLFLLFAGHNAPGGGFVGGLVAGAAFVLRYIDAGPERGAGRLPGVLLGCGLGVAILTGALGWVNGGEFLQSMSLDVDLPVLGTVHAGSTLLFDVGVYLVVVGLVRTVLSVLGGKVQT